MIELPFHNDFFSLIEPENKEEIVEHCLDPALELPKEDFEWGDECLSEKVHLKLTGFTELKNRGVLKLGGRSVLSTYCVFPGKNNAGYCVVKLNACISVLVSRALNNSVLN